jgi:hypothetical protein
VDCSFDASAMAASVAKSAIPTDFRAGRADHQMVMRNFSSAPEAGRLIRAALGGEGSEWMQ